MYLVLGSSGPVAHRIVREISGRGERVFVIGGKELVSRFPKDVRCLSGNERSIDFGLTGSDYQGLLAEVDEIIVALLPDAKDRDPAASLLVRGASEVCDFVRAGGDRAKVRFLSSLLVFGNARGPLHEEDFFLGQGFADDYERSVALAEKKIRSLSGKVPLSILRSGPVVGGEDDASILPGALLDQLMTTLNSEGNERGVVLSDAPVRIDTAGRVAAALLRLTPTDSLKVAHLVDRLPITDRQLASLVSQNLGRPFHEIVGNAGVWHRWRRGAPGGSRALWGWPVEFTRTMAELELSDLLDRDELGAIAALLGEKS